LKPRFITADDPDKTAPASTRAFITLANGRPEKMQACPDVAASNYCNIGVVSNIWFQIFIGNYWDDHPVQFFALLIIVVCTSIPLRTDKELPLTWCSSI